MSAEYGGSKVLWGQSIYNHKTGKTFKTSVRDIDVIYGVKQGEVLFGRTRVRVWFNPLNNLWVLQND